MNKRYHDPSNPASFGGISRLYNENKRQGESTSYREVKKFLSMQDSYTLHKPVRKNFPRNRFMFTGIDDTWQSDLADMSSLNGSNDGWKYLLITIDGLSKFLWVQPLKTKESTSVLSAIRRLFREQKRRPKNWLVDKGGEFVNNKLTRFMRDNGINFYTTSNAETKAAVAERVIRTLKGRIFRYLTMKNSWRYIDVLNNIVSSYNNSLHRSIGMRPVDVTTSDVLRIKQRLYPPLKNVKVKPKFSVDDNVRLAKQRTPFQKGFHQLWTEEVFRVAEVVMRIPPVYRISDANGDILQGTFYEAELQKVILKPSHLYKVERILEEKVQDGKTFYRVKWQGYPDNMSSWIPATNLQAI